MSRLLSLLIVGLLVAPVFADDAAETDPCITELTAEKLDNPPERKTKYERLEEPWKERLLDVKVADQKYAAVIRIQVPFRHGKPFDPDSKYKDTNGRFAEQLLQSRESKEFKNTWELQRFLGQLLLEPSPGRVGAGVLSEESFKEPFKRMLAQIPAGRLPPEEQLAFFSAPNVSSYVDSSWLDARGGIKGNTSRRSSDFSGKQHDIRILAISPEEAEQRARTMLMILDQGFSRPIQVALFKERMKSCGGLPEARAKSAASQKEYDTLNAKLKEYEEFTADMLSGLRVQQLQMEVDLAGVKARLETCERLLSKLPRDSGRRKQIEDAKIGAEIELSGFEARRAKAAEFVAKVKDRNELSTKLGLAGDKSKNTKQQLDYYIAYLRELDNEIEAFGPVRLVDDKVTIHPLEWVQ